MKDLFFIVLFSIVTISLFGQGFHMDANVGGGIGLGSILAAIASWSRNESIIWAMVSAFFGWLYLIYFAFTR